MQNFSVFRMAISNYNVSRLELAALSSSKGVPDTYYLNVASSHLQKSVYLFLIALLLNCGAKVTEGDVRVDDLTDLDCLKDIYWLKESEFENMDMMEGQASLVPITEELKVNEDLKRYVFDNIHSIKKLLNMIERNNIHLNIPDYIVNNVDTFMVWEMSILAGVKAHITFSEVDKGFKEIGQFLKDSLKQLYEDMEFLLKEVEFHDNRENK